MGCAYGGLESSVRGGAMDAARRKQLEILVDVCAVIGVASAVALWIDDRVRGRRQPIAQLRRMEW